MTHTTTCQPAHCGNATLLHCHSSVIHTNIFLSFALSNFCLSSMCPSCVQDGRKKGKRRDEVGKRTREKQGKESASLTDTPPESISQRPPDDQNVEPEVVDVYTRLLHRKASLLIIFPHRFYLKGGTRPILHTKFSLLVMRSTQPVVWCLLWLWRSF